MDDTVEFDCLDTAVNEKLFEYINQSINKSS
jgi:hypothetical protein